MKVIACSTGFLALLFSFLAFESVAISFGTTCYHFTMRLAVGAIIDRLMQNKANYRRRWFCQRPWEPGLYKLLAVKKWKSKFPTYDPSLFDHKKHSWDEIVQATCQAEIVHEVIAVLSFLPLLAAIPFGALPVFLITSVASACFDISFVIMQRFNRPRLIKLIEKADV